MSSQDPYYGPPTRGARADQPYPPAPGRPANSGAPGNSYPPDAYGSGPEGYGSGPEGYGSGPEGYGRPVGPPVGPGRPSGPGRWGGGPGGPGGRMIAIFVGLGLLGLLIGVGAAKLTAGGSSNQGTANPGQSGTTTQPVTGGNTTGPGASISPSPVVTLPPNYTPIAADPTTEKGLDFGFLKKVTTQNGVVTLTFDRASYYVGAEAITHNKGQLPEPDNGDVASQYLVVNTNPTLRAFTVDPKASIIAALQLRTHSGVVAREKLTVQELVQNFAKVPDHGAYLPVWIRHTNGLDGPVTALSEQYFS